LILQQIRQVPIPVIFGGGEEYKIAGKGNMKIEMQAKWLLFFNVFFVLELDKESSFYQ
jgi:hypothetical protein